MKEDKIPSSLDEGGTNKRDTQVKHMHARGPSGYSVAELIQWLWTQGHVELLLWIYVTPFSLFLMHKCGLSSSQGDVDASEFLHGRRQLGHDI